MYNYLIVGAGFAGCILAERLATQLNKKILLIDKRSHIAGNAHDFYNSDGILVHSYGPHLFHTNDEKIFKYLSQFTEWHSYQHKVLSSVNGKLVPMPINRTTVNLALGYNFQTDEEVEKFFLAEKENITEISNSEDFVVSKVGRRLYEFLYKGYTTKHWGREPKQLSPSVCGRLPIRTNTNDKYFDDTFQAMPLYGYTKMFEKMISHLNIEIQLNTDFKTIDTSRYEKIIYTGPIDEFFECKYGKLPYRSLRFEFETFEQEFFQPVAQINYPNHNNYTRITEFKHITGQKHPKTTIAREYSLADGEPYYPIPQKENSELYNKYKQEAEKLSSVYFVGRLATYQYYNMDQVTAQALLLFEKIAKGEK